MNKKAIYMSIHPIHIQRILTQVKNHEFRNYIPKESFNFIYVYVTTPVKALKYIIKIDNIIKYPNQINYDGFGNKDFNLGIKSIYAYEIHSVYELENYIPLNELKKDYNFTPPQSFAYDIKYSKLTNQILSSKLNLLFTNKITK